MRFSKRIFRLAWLSCLVAARALAGPAAAQCAGTPLLPMEPTEYIESFVRDGDTMLVRHRDFSYPGGKNWFLVAYGLDRVGTPQTEDDRWLELGELRSGAQEEGHLMGLALSGTTALVGFQPYAPAPLPPSVVEWYERLDGGTPDDPWDDTWVQMTSLEGTGPSSETEGFGDAISLAGGTVLVGAPDTYSQTWPPTPPTGAAYVFERDDRGTPGDPLDDAWILAQKLVPPPDYTYFAGYLALQQDMALIRAANDGGDPSNDVLVFGRDASGTPGEPWDDHWVALGGLRAAGEPGESFGMSIAMSADLAMVGALQFDTGGNGKVCVFQRTDPGTPADPLDDVWTETSQFTTAERTTAFGTHLALAGERVLVGSWGDGSSLLTHCGFVYLFERDESGTPADPLDDLWVEVEKYLPVHRTNQDHFGQRPVSLLEDEVLIASDKSVYGYRAGEPCAAFVGPRAGLGFNVECLTSVTRPELGGVWRLEIDTGAHPLPLYSILLVMDRPLSPGLIFQMMGVHRELLVDLVTGYPVLTDQLLADPGGVDTFVYPVPPEPALIGLQMFLQGGVLGGGQGYLTNALNAVAGLAPGS